MDASQNNVAFDRIARQIYGPDWRSTLAGRAENRGGPASFLSDDPMVSRLAEYVHLAGQGECGRQQARSDDPEIHEAILLWQDAPLREELKLAVLGGLPPATIARRLGVAVSTVQAAEQIFFDVRPVLDARDWIVHKVLKSEQRAGNPQAAVRLRTAYFGGPSVAELILDAADDLPLAEADRLLDQTVLLHLKAQEALEIRLRGSADALQFTKLWLDHQRRMKKLDLEVEKFRHRCQKLPAARPPASAKPQSGQPAGSAPATADNMNPVDMTNPADNTTVNKVDAAEFGPEALRPKRRQCA